MIRQLLLAFLMSAHFITSTPAQQPQSTNNPPTQSTEKTRPLNAALVKKVVGFLRVSFVKNGRSYQSEGTCFFVFYEDKRLGDGRGFIYLVTNRHVAAPGSEEGHLYPIQSTKIRLNLRAPTQAQGAEESDLPLNGQNHWYFPEDDGVDLAVLPIFPDQTKYDYEPFPVSMFATNDRVANDSIAEGDNILFTGYFYQFPGTKRIEPIIREGVLAMIPDELMETTLHKPGKLYLADVHVFGGNSGSPMFVNVGGFRNGAMSLGGFPYLLLGIVSGGYSEDADLKLTIATTLRGTVAGNSGIATVVPVDELKALLDSPALTAVREAEVNANRPKN